MTRAAPRGLGLLDLLVALALLGLLVWIVRLDWYRLPEDGAAAPAGARRAP